MFFDILIVFVISLISSLCLSTSSVHALPSSSGTHSSAAGLPSTLRLFHHDPMPSVDYDLGGDISAMLIGESNELSSTNKHDDSSSLSSVSPLIPSLDAFNEPYESYFQPLPSQFLSRKLLLALKRTRQDGDEDQEDHQRKRSSSPSISSASSLPTQFHFNSALVSPSSFAEPSNGKSVVNLNRLSESTRLSPSLQLLVETNPFARAWLTMLLQKVMEEQPEPYIFKYGRRRK